MDDVMYDEPSYVGGEEDDWGTEFSRWAEQYQADYGADVLDAVMCNRSFSIIRHDHPMVKALERLDRLAADLKRRASWQAEHGDDLPF